MPPTSANPWVSPPAPSASAATDLGLTALAALHDLDQAASSCDRLAVLNQGALVAVGARLDVLTPTFLADVLGVRAHIGENPLTGRPRISVAPLGKRP